MFPLGAIAPVSFLWKPYTNQKEINHRTLWVWVHPAAYEEALNTLKEKSTMFVQSLKFKICLTIISFFKERSTVKV